MKFTILFTVVIAIHGTQSLTIPEDMDLSPEIVHGTNDLEGIQIARPEGIESVPLLEGIETADVLENGEGGPSGYDEDLFHNPLLARPTVTASDPQATIIGSSIDGVETFNGIPYAQKPVGTLRFKPPQPLQWPARKSIYATGIPRACPQFMLSIESTNPRVLRMMGEIVKIPIFHTITHQGEDCLTLNVQRPRGTRPGDKLPVLFWVGTYLVVYL